MAIKYSLPIEGINDLKQKKVAFIADPTAADATGGCNVQATVKKIVDCLISAGMVATA